MLSSGFCRVIAPSRTMVTILQRNLTVSAVAAQSKQTLDPIQQLFLDKVREYKQKSEAIGGKLVDADEQLQKELDESLNRTLRQFGGNTHEEMNRLPSFTFPEPKLDPINLEQK